MLFFMFPISLVSSQDSRIIVTVPQLRLGQVSPIVGREVAVVWVNVTSLHIVSNVTLHYMTTRNEGQPTEPKDHYSVVIMNLISGNRFNGTYETLMPKVENATFVWGFARALDSHGNRAESETWNIYYAMTPNPDSSYLDLVLYVRHVNPRTMQMNLTVSYARLLNAHDYEPQILSVSHYDSIRLTKPEGKYTYTNEGRTLRVFYSGGHAELYPFDGYDYTFRVSLPNYLNNSVIRVGGVAAKPHVVYNNSIPLVPVTQDERLDNSA
jgi:hypothetical protein